MSHLILPTMGEARKFPPGMLLKSERAYFADAYSTVVRGDYEGAVKRFAEMADHYPVDEIALPYFAYAAAKTGDKLKIETVVTNTVHSSGDFDARLASAFFAASHHKIDDAVLWLGWAYRARPNTERTNRIRPSACALWRWRDTWSLRPNDFVPRARRKWTRREPGSVRTIVRAAARGNRQQAGALSSGDYMRRQVFTLRTGGSKA